MPESILVDQKDKAIPSHHDNPLRSFRCASYALKGMDEVNDHYYKQPSHLTNYMRVHMMPLWVFTIQLANKTIFHGDSFQRNGKRISRPLRAKNWDSLVTGTSASGPLANVPVTRLPRYRHSHVAGTHSRCTRSMPVTSIYCTMISLHLNLSIFLSCILSWIDGL